MFAENKRTDDDGDASNYKKRNLKSIIMKILHVLQGLRLTTTMSLVDYVEMLVRMIMITIMRMVTRNMIALIMMVAKMVIILLAEVVRGILIIL